MEQKQFDILVLKTNWKQLWQRKIVRLCSYVFGIPGVLIMLAGIIETLASTTSKPETGNGMKESEALIIFPICILILCFLCGWVSMLIKRLFPITYTFEAKADSGKLCIRRNGKIILCADKDNITSVQFVTNITRTATGAELTKGSSQGDTLLVDYTVNLSNGKKKNKKFKMMLSWLEETDRVRLKSFLNSVLHLDSLMSSNTQYMPL